MCVCVCLSLSLFLLQPAAHTYSDTQRDGQEFEITYLLESIRIRVTAALRHSNCFELFSWHSPFGALVWNQSGRSLYWDWQFSVDRKRGQRKGAMSKNVKNREKVSKLFSTLFGIFCAGPKNRQKVSKLFSTLFFSTIFGRHPFSGPFWEGSEIYGHY